MSSPLAVPVIDITAFRDGTGVDTVAAAVDDAARTVGFMQITGHGIPDEVAAGLADAIDDLFALPVEEKLALRAPTTAVNRGYSGPRTERLSYSVGVTSAADLFEAFNTGFARSQFPDLELPGEHYPDNIWPLAPASFRPRVEAWMDHAQALAHTMTGIFAHALGLPAGHFETLTDHSIDVLRMNHYQLPPGEVALEPGQLGMGPHTDYGIVTILWADNVRPGLQILATDGSWHDVTPVPGALLINLGDALPRWTNDRWRSTMHRVLAPIDENGRPIRRRSAAFFHDGNVDALIECLPGCADAANPPRYQPVTVGQHLAVKLAGSRGGVVNDTAPQDAARLDAAHLDAARLDAARLDAARA
jgi:isopenicillin N synthase-like dioxygenase